MKTTVKTFAIISIITLGTASAFAKPANGNKTTQSKTVTTTTVKTTTTTKTVKEEPKKVASKPQAKPQSKPAPKKEVGHKRENENRRRHVAKHEAPKPSKAPVAKKEPPKPAAKPVTVVKKVEVIKQPAQTSCKPATVVKTTTRPAPVTVVKEVEVRPASVEVDGKSLVAGAIIGGIIGLTVAAAAAN